jgi:hypothetical protein
VYSEFLLRVSGKDMVYGFGKKLGASDEEIIMLKGKLDLRHKFMVGLFTVTYVDSGETYYFRGGITHAGGEVLVEGVWQDRGAGTDTFRLTTKEANVYFNKGTSQIPPGPGSKKAHKQCACDVENGAVLLIAASGKNECKRCHHTCKMCYAVAYNQCTSCKPYTDYPKAHSVSLVSGICEIGCESGSFRVPDPKTPGLSLCQSCH